MNNMSEQFKMPAGLGPQGRANLTILQGGFSVGQRVTFAAPGKGKGKGKGQGSAKEAKDAKTKAKAKAKAKSKAKRAVVAPSAGKLSKWVVEKGAWEVLCDSGETLVVKADKLTLEGQSEVVEELHAEKPGKDGDFLGRQAVVNPQVGDIIEILYEGHWTDASIIDLPKQTKKKSTGPGAAKKATKNSPFKGSFRVVLLDKCIEAMVPATLVRRKENFAQQRKRREAIDLATAKLKSGKTLTDDDVLEVLRAWSFTQNAVRKNVIPEGESWVYSDTFGLVRNRSGSSPIESRLTTDFPQIFEFLSTWCRQRTKSQARYRKDPFPFTSINVNFGYNAKLHRDSFNDGPSLLTSLGNFKGGELGYFPDDNKKLKLEQLPPSKMKIIETKSKFCTIDGRRAHCVQDYEGERFSIVFFTTMGYAKTRAATRQRLIDLGAAWPSPKALAQAKRALPAPKGYKAITSTEARGSQKRGRSAVVAEAPVGVAASVVGRTGTAASVSEAAEGTSRTAEGGGEEGEAAAAAPPAKKIRTAATLSGLEPGKTPDQGKSASAASHSHTPRKQVGACPATPVTTAVEAAALVASAAAAVQAAKEAKGAPPPVAKPAGNGAAEVQEKSATPEAARAAAVGPPGEASSKDLNTLRFRVKGLPHLALGLKLGKVYTMKQLVKKCRGKQAVVQSLRRKLSNEQLFERIEPGVEVGMA